MSQSIERPAFHSLSLEELAESEHRHRNLVEALPDAIIVHTEGKIVYANPFALRLHKASSPEQLLGREISDFIDPHCLGSIKQRIEECYATGTASPPAEFVLKACDGSVVDVESVAIPISRSGNEQRKQPSRGKSAWNSRRKVDFRSDFGTGIWLQTPSRGQTRVTCSLGSPEKPSRVAWMKH